MIYIFQLEGVVLKEVKKEAESHPQTAHVEYFTVRNVADTTVTCLIDVLKVSPSSRTKYFTFIYMFGRTILC